MWCTHGSVYTTWPCTRAVSVAISGHGPCTRPCGVHTPVYTCRIHGRIRAVYMVVFTAMCGPCTRWPPCTRPVHGHGLCTHVRDRYTCTRPWTWPCTGRRPPYTACTDRLHGLYMAVYRPCTRAVNTAVYTYTTVFTAVCTACKRPCIRSCIRIHGRVYSPCTPIQAVYSGHKDGRDTAV